MKQTEKRATILFLITLLILVVSACDGNKEVVERERYQEPFGNALTTWPDHPDALAIRIDKGITYQEMDNFGASDCWSAQFVGNWPVAKKTIMADWLFSRDTLTNGQPVGIGLNAWRFNIGAGSAEQGDQSQIVDEWRRSESFLNSDGSYNWNKQSGQRWFLEAAKERGVDRFIGFSNSPPVHYTKNGLAHGDETSPENISLSSLPDFANYLVDVTRGLQDVTGVEFTHLSPFNEPQWDWTGDNQEGCYLNNSTARELVRLLNQTLESAADLDTRIVISEAGEWDYLYSKGDRTGNQLDYFFGGELNPLADASRLDKVIAGHSYYTTYPSSALINKRESVWNKASEYPGMSVWSTEYCPLGSADLNQLGWNSWHKDLSMRVALYVARILHHDLVYAHVSAWQWWLAISNSNYPDGLIYVSDDKSDGTYTDSKLMWTLGNFSRFIEPGARRIYASCEEEGLLVSTFLDDANNRLTTVVLNTTENNQIASFQFGGMKIAALRPYITSDYEEHNLFPLESLDADVAFEIPALCAITFTSSFH